MRLSPPPCAAAASRRSAAEESAVAVDALHGSHGDHAMFRQRFREGGIDVDLDPWNRSKYDDFKCEIQIGRWNTMARPQHCDSPKKERDFGA